MSSRGEDDDTADVSRDTEPLLPPVEDKIESRPSSPPHSTSPLEDVLLIRIHKDGASEDGEIDQLMLEPPQCRICLDNEGASSAISLRVLDHHFIFHLTMLHGVLMQSFEVKDCRPFSKQEQKIPLFLTC